MDSDAIALGHLVSIDDRKTRMPERDGSDMDQFQTDLNDNWRRSGHDLRRRRNAARGDHHQFARGFFSLLGALMAFVKVADGREGNRADKKPDKNGAAVAGKERSAFEARPQAGPFVRGVFA